MKSSRPLAQFKNVSLIRGKRKVLQNVNWLIRRGEHWFILGPNGSGKTSLLEMMLGYLWPCEGSVEVLGEVYGRTYLPELRKKIGYVAPWVDEHIRKGESVFEVVASGSEGCTRYLGVRTRILEKAVFSQLKKLGLEAFSGREYHRLSTGEKLKVILARALMAQPLILILDEPFSALDMGARYRVLDFLRILAGQKNSPALILVTHYLEDIQSFYTHGLTLKKGRVVFAGPALQAKKYRTLKRLFDIPVFPE